MLLYFDKHGLADPSRIHVSTDWYILKSSDVNDLTINNRHWSKLGETIDIDKIIANITLADGAIGYVYVIKRFSDNSFEELPIKEIHPNDFKTYLVHSNVINIEPGRLRVLSNNIHEGGDLVLEANPIRPRSAKLKKIHISIYNRMNLKIAYKTFSSLYASFSVNDLENYVVGERLYIKYHMESTSNISSMVQTLLVSGYDNLPSLGFDNKHIDASMDLLITLNDPNYSIYTWWLSIDGRPITQDNANNLVIDRKYLEYGKTYSLRTKIKGGPDGETIYDITSTITTVPRREIYDINNDYTYEEVKEISGFKENNTISYGEELFTGNILTLYADSLLYKDAHNLNKDSSLYSFATETFIEGEAIVLTVDNYKNIVIDESYIYIYRTDYTIGKASLFLRIDKPNTGFNYTVNYTDKKLYTIIGSSLVSISLLDGSLETVVDIPNANTLTKVLYMGYDRIFIMGGKESVHIYTVSNNRLDLVEGIPTTELSSNIKLMLGMDGNPIIYSYDTKKLFYYDTGTDSFNDANNISILQDSDIENIYRLRNGAIRFVGSDKIFEYK